MESKLRESNSQTISVLAHPGLAQTNLQSKSVAANGSWQEAFAYKLMAPLFQDASMGALPQLLAATSPDVKGGQYYGPRFNFKGYPKLCKVAKFALSEKNRKRLWEESHKLIHRCRN